MATFQEIQARKAYRLEVAKLTKKDLSEICLVVPKTKEGTGLRAMTSKIGLPNLIDFNGVTQQVKQLKKEDLVNLIWDDLAEERTMLALEIDQIAVKKIVDDCNDVTESDLGRIASESFDSIREYAEGLWTHTGYRATDGTILNLTSDVSRKLQSKISVKTGELITATTVMRYKSTIKQIVGELIDQLEGHQHHQKVVEIFNLVYGHKTAKGYKSGELDRAIATQSKLKSTASNVNLSDRKEKQSKTKMIGLIVKAIEILDTLDPEDNPRNESLWQKVAISLMLITGRRLSEIMSTAKFYETVKYGWILFEGQLKTKGNICDPYEIPVLVSFETIDKAMVWLETNGKRQPSPEKAHQTYSKPLSATTKQLDSLIEYEYRASTKTGERFLTSHACRQIYAQIWKESGEISGAPHYRISKILGHGKEDNHTADCYDADYEVTDARQILEQFGRAVR